MLNVSVLNLAHQTLLHAGSFGSFPRPPVKEVSIATSGDLIRRILSRLIRVSPNVVESSVGFDIPFPLHAGAVLVRFLGRSIDRAVGLTGDYKVHQ
jgi:hypothetical protein